MVAKKLRMKIVWKGKGINTRGYYKGKIIIECNKKYLDLGSKFPFRKTIKSKKILGWKPKTNISQLIDEMVTEDLKSLSE